MGSSFSIYNNTDHDIYVWNGVQWDYVALGIGVGVGVGAAAAAGAGVAVGAGVVLALKAAVAAAGFSSASLAGTVIIPVTVLGVSTKTWGLVSLAAAGGTAAVQAALNLTHDEAKKITAEINTFKNGCDRKLAPGQTYTYNGSLSLTRSVYLMNENGITTSRGCWTGATDKSNIAYKVSRDWDWGEFKNIIQFKNN